MIARDLDELGVGIAEPGITPNYVLMQDKSYREVRLVSIGIQLGPLIGVQKGPLRRDASWPEAA